MREICDYTCPKCGNDLTCEIDWDEREWDLMGNHYLTGACKCKECGIWWRFTDHIVVTETEVEVEE